MNQTIIENMKADGIDVDAIYFGDDYPRAGCIAAIDVQKDGFILRIYAPGGQLLESYASAATPRAAARMLEEWLCGYAPRIRSRLDHSPVKS